jgi:hypothetical protein
MDSTIQSTTTQAMHDQVRVVKKFHAMPLGLTGTFGIEPYDA